MNAKTVFLAGLAVVAGLILHFANAPHWLGIPVGVAIGLICCDLLEDDDNEDDDA